MAQIGHFRRKGCGVFKNRRHRIDLCLEVVLMLAVKSSSIHMVGAARDKYDRARPRRTNANCECSRSALVPYSQQAEVGFSETWK